MSHYSYEALSAEDNAILAWESASLPMHSASIHIFEAAPVELESGGVDFARIKHHIASRLHTMPGFRQRLMSYPGESKSVWVDDAHFSIDYHVRHSALPRPGGKKELLALASRIDEQALDRTRPLWETWIIEGLDGHRFAMLNKVHLCLLDGQSSFGAIEHLFSAEPDETLREAPPFHPSRPPSRTKLFRDAMQQRLLAPIAAASAGIRATSQLRATAESTRQQLGLLADRAKWILKPAEGSPLNGPVGPHRKFEGLETPLQDVMKIRRRLTCSVDDLVVAICAGALRRFLLDRRVRVEAIDFRMSIPSGFHRRTGQGRLERRMPVRVVSLPLSEVDPLARLERVRSATREQALEADAKDSALLDAWMELCPFDVANLAARVELRAAHCSLWHPRGPRHSVYLLGARQLAAYPQPALSPNQGVAISVHAYDGVLYWGLTGDANRVPDLHEFAQALHSETEAFRCSLGLDDTKKPRVSAAASETGDGAQPAPIYVQELAVPAAARVSRPSDVRRAVIEQHDTLKKNLEAIEATLERGIETDPVAHEIARDLAAQLYDNLGRHIDFEDAHLVPYVRLADAWGDERASRIEQEHREQREVLAFMAQRLEDDTTTASVFVDQLRVFVRTLRADMQHEEEAILTEDLLRDDVVSLSAISG